MKKKRIGWALALGTAVGLLAWSWQQDLTVSRYTLPLPTGLEGAAGLRVAQISDLHSAKVEAALAPALKEEKPDLIVITGDLVNREDRNFDRALSLAAMAVSVAPTYFVPGNHEVDNPCYARLRGGLLVAGVTVLEDQAVEIPYGDAVVNLIGAADVTFVGKTRAEGRQILPSKVNSLCGDGVLNLLISHRPAMLEAYGRCAVQGVFCGHAHGGQVRLPLLGPVYTPDEGMWPHVTEGVHWTGQVPVVVSRGLGNGTPAPRLWNGPELVVTTFLPEKAISAR